MSEKFVQVLTWNFRDAADKDLVHDLHAIDPEIEFTGRAMLSGRPDSFHVLDLVITGVVTTVVPLIVAAIVKYAKKLFKTRDDVEMVRIHGPDGEVVSEVRRHKSEHPR